MKNRTLCIALLSSLALGAQAQTQVSDAWVRATVPQQKATGMFVQLTSPKGGQLVAASSPAAAAVEIHEMKIDESGVMRMREMPALQLPAGQTVALKPGGYHLMLMGLKQQAKPGDTVPVTLVVEGADRQRETVQVQAVVRALNSAGPAAASAPR